MNKAIWDELDAWEFNIKKSKLKGYFKYIICKLFHTKQCGWIVDNQRYITYYCKLCHRMWEEER